MEPKATLMVQSNPQKANRQPQIPDDATIPLQPERENGHQTKPLPENAILRVPVEIEPIEFRHHLLMPDTTTLLLRPESEKVPTKVKPSLHQRVLRALNKRKTQRPDKRSTTSMPVFNMDMQVYGQVEHGEAAVPVNPVHDAPISPFSAAYVTERLNRSICDAQTEKNFNEAIRLQLLQWKMQDNEISPIEVARKAWLRPAAEKSTETSAS